MNQQPESSTEYSECLAYLVNPRKGNNFYARIIAALYITFTTSVDTLCVYFGENRRLHMSVNHLFFGSLAPAVQKLALVHEAGHVLLRHLERVARMLARVDDPELKKTTATIALFAAELANNDSTVRGELEFHEAREAGLLDTWLFPEDFGLPLNKSVEQYMDLICDELPKVHDQMRQRGENDAEGEGGGEGEEGDENDESGDGEGDESDDSEGTPKTPKHSPVRGKTKPPKNDDDMGQPPAKADGMNKNGASKDLLRALQQMFDEQTQGSHAKALDQLLNMTAEELADLSARMKQQAQQAVGRAHRDTLKSKGLIPSRLEGEITRLLKDEDLPWDQYLKNCVSDVISTKITEGYMLPIYGLLDSDHYEPWPGFGFDVAFSIGWITDVSGSVSTAEYTRACAAINSLMNSNNRIQLVEWQVDSVLHYEGVRSNLQAYTAEAKPRKASGGTRYAPAFHRILRADTANDWHPNSERLEEVPAIDMLIVFTDGGVFPGDLEECLGRYHPRVPILWLVSDKGTPDARMQNVTPDRVVQMVPLSNGDD